MIYVVIINCYHQKLVTFVINIKRLITLLKRVKHWLEEKNRNIPSNKRFFFNFYFSCFPH